MNATDNSATVLVVTMKCAGSDDFHYEGQFNIQKKGTFVLYALAAAKQKQAGLVLATGVCLAHWR